MNRIATLSLLALLIAGCEPSIPLPDRGDRIRSITYRSGSVQDFNQGDSCVLDVEGWVVSIGSHDENRVSTMIDWANVTSVTHPQKTGD